MDLIYTYTLRLLALYYIADINFYTRNTAFVLLPCKCLSSPAEIGEQLIAPWPKSDQQMELMANFLRKVLTVQLYHKHGVVLCAFTNDTPSCISVV